MRKLHRIAWCLTPGRWTQAHVTEDERTTLCGLRVPAFPFHQHRNRHAEDHRGVCRKCWRGVKEGDEVR